MTGVSRLLAAYDKLGRAARQAADYILEDPRTAAGMSVTEIAAASGVSAATVARLASALGYDGFIQFRAALSESKRDQVSYAGSDGEGDPRLLRLFAEYLNRMNNTLAVADPAKLTGLAAALRSASRVMIAGFEADQPLVQYLARRLNMASIPAAGAADAPLVTAMAASLSEDCLFIGICHSERRGAVYDALRAAKRKKCVTAFLAADPGSPAAGSATYFLRAFEPQDDPMNSIGRLALCEALLRFAEEP